MSRSLTPSDFRAEFCHRLRVAREAAGIRQTQVAAVLGISVNAYRKYERCTLLPHHLLMAACRLLRVQLPYFLDMDAYQVKCARCGRVGLCSEFVAEEGDEWECAACNDRENARERARLG